MWGGPLRGPPPPLYLGDEGFVVEGGSSISASAYLGILPTDLPSRGGWGLVEHPEVARLT